MSNLKDNFTEFLSKVEQMEKDNEKLTEDVRNLEKEKAEGWAKFNTDTHILLEKRTLESLQNSVMEAKNYIDDVKYEADETQNYAINTRDNADYAMDSMELASERLSDILETEEEVEQ